MSCLGIVSPNYSGSTIAGVILEGYDRTAHLGEIWKVRHPDRKIGFCRECGPESHCPRFSRDVLLRLASVKKEDFWLTCQHIFGVDWVISGDKNPNHYLKETGIPDRFLIVIKNPISAAMSYAKREYDIKLVEGALDVDKLPWIEQGLMKYSSILAERYRWVQQTCRPYCFVSIESLSLSNATELSRVATNLFGKDREYFPHRVKENMHYVGGNHKVSRGSDRYFGNAFKPDYRYQEVMTSRAIDYLLDIYEEKFDFRSFLEPEKELLNTNWLWKPSWLIKREAQ